MTEWNARPLDPVSAVKTYSISFNVANGPSINIFGLGSYNPFTWNDASVAGRGNEIHLTGKTPTAKANLALFGTGSDNSSVAAARYYQTATGLPWTIDIPIKPFKYPIEQTGITFGYLKFQIWAESNGSQFADWYSNTSDGYRDLSKLY